jgi:dihydroxyacid dehydratase/phosphogluconate dehydratase
MPICNSEQMNNGIGDNYMNDFHNAGGMMALLQVLRPLLHLSALTVTLGLRSINSGVLQPISSTVSKVMTPCSSGCLFAIASRWTLKPSGDNYMNDFHNAGGMMALLQVLRPLLHLSALTGMTRETKGLKLAE